MDRHIRKIVLSNCLCYMLNKFRRIPSKPLKSVVVEFYSSEEISSAKELLIEAADSLNNENLPKINVSRRRRESSSKSALEIDDIITILSAIDEVKLLDDLPMFVADSPENMPATKLLEGDMELLWKKIEKLEGIVSGGLRDLNEDIKYLKLKTVQPVNVGMPQSGSKVTNYRRAICIESSADKQIINSQSVHMLTKSATDERVSGNQGVSITDRWGSSVEDESDSARDDRPYTRVESKRKRKSIVQGVSPSDVIPSKRVDYRVQSNPPISYAGIITNHPAQSTDAVTMGASMARASAQNNKIIGKSNCSALKAANTIKSAIDKSVFSIHNVADQYDVSDIKNHCKQLNIRVLFCFNISRQDQKSRSFKLAVAKVEENKIMDSSSWPAGVVVRPWNYKPACTNVVSESEPVRINVDTPCVLSINEQSDNSSSTLIDQLELQIIQPSIAHTVNGNSDLHNNNPTGNTTDQPTVDYLDCQVINTHLSLRSDNIRHAAASCKDDVPLAVTRDTSETETNTHDE